MKEKDWYSSKDLKKMMEQKDFLIETQRLELIRNREDISNKSREIDKLSFIVTEGNREIIDLKRRSGYLFGGIAFLLIIIACLGLYINQITN